MIWEYKLDGDPSWKETDSYTLLFILIPTGKVTSYRVKENVKIGGLLV